VPVALIGYARVSTHDQHPEAQTDALDRAGCARVFVDQGVSGKLARRPQLDACLAYVRPGDVLTVTKLDRLGRSLRHLIDLSADLDRDGVGLRVLDQGIDTSTPGGRLFFHLVAAFAEFERDLISERTLDGLAAARARGRNGGRRPKLTAQQATLARRLYDERKHTVAEIGAMFGVSRQTVYRHLADDTGDMAEHGHAAPVTSDDMETR
jgi:DNA invertase Pin-like site-specific DNA recombinase